MESFFFDDDYELIIGSSSGSGSDSGLLIWSDEIQPSAAHNFFPNLTSFVPYSDGITTRDRNRAEPVNINKRIVEFARRSWPTWWASSREIEKEKGYRHMMSERLRREKQKQSYSALHSLLLNGTKNDKNSIIIAASTEIRHLQRCKQELEKRNLDLNKANLDVVRVEDSDTLTQGTKIKVRVENPASGIDSMLEALRCIDSLGLKTTSIRSSVSSSEFSAVIRMREEIAAVEVEKVVQRKLLEAERKLRNKFHGVAQSFTWTNCIFNNKLN